MKILSVFFMMLFAVGAMASSSQTRTFFYDGSQDSVNMSLQAEQTHTEYRYEQRWTTCYRQVVYYETRCYGRPHRCEQFPVYRTVPYSCMQTISIPYEVKDYDVQAEVSLNFEELATELPIAETIKVTLFGENLILEAVGSKRFFVLSKKTSHDTQVSGTMKYVDASYTLSLVEAAPVLKSIAMNNISMKNSVLKFDVGAVEVRDLIGFSLEVKKDPIVGSSTVLLNRELAASELAITATETGAIAQVNLKDLGVNLSNGRHTLTPKIFFKHEGSLINKDQFAATSASRTLIYKIR